MSKMPRTLCKSLLVISQGIHLCANSQSIDDLDIGNAIKQAVAQNSARSIVLSDANLVTLGIVDFDPNEFVDFNNINVGDESTLKERSTLTIYSLPWSLKSRDLSDKLQSQLQLRFSYLSTKQDLIFDDENIGNPLQETTYLLYAENTWRYNLNDNWQLQGGVGGEVLFYENELDYRDELLQIFAPYFDRSLFNTSYRVWTLDPSLGASYSGEVFDHRWEYRLMYRYAVGHTFNTDSHVQDTTVEAGRLSNSLIFHYDTPDLWSRRSQIRLLARRIDLSADAVPAMGTHHYYELGAGWLLDTSSDISFLNNIGIGLSMNIDSELSGGSVVILFNERL